MENDYYDLDKWKTFVLRVLLEKNGSSLTDYVWNRLKHEFSLGENEQTEHNLYTESVLKCLEVEHGLIRTNKRGIQITTKGEEVAKMNNGFRSYLDSKYRHRLLQRINDYVVTATGILSLMMTMFSFVNLFYNWIDKKYSFLPPLILGLFLVVFRLYNPQNEMFSHFGTKR